MDETRKRQNLARELVQTSGGLMDVLYDLDACRRKAASAGLAFADADFTGVAGLEHLTAADVEAALAAIPTITAAFVSGNFDDVFEALRQ